MTAHSHPSATKPTHLALVVVAICVSVYSLSPFAPSLVSSELPGRLLEALVLRRSDLGWKLVGHFSAFVMLGTALELALGSRLKAISPLRLISMVALGCLVIETGQLAQSARHARVIDLITNIAAMSGAILVLGRLSAMAPVRKHLLRALTERMYLWNAGLFVIGTVAWIATGFYPIIQLQRTSWVPGMGLCVANETDGSRPWLGNLSFIGLYDQSLSKKDIVIINRAPTPKFRIARRTSLGLVLGYPFNRAPSKLVLPYGSIASPSFTIRTPQEPSSYQDGASLAIDEPVSLQPDNPITQLSERLIRSGAFSVEVWIQAKDTRQTGPARIVTLSDGPYERNFTLAQEGPDLEFRVRNGINGENGLVYALRISNAVDTTPKRFFATYDHGVSTIRDQDGRSLGSLDLREPIPYLGLGTNEAGRIASVLLLVGLVALPLSLMLQRHSLIARHTITLTTVVLIGSLPFLITCWTIGGPLHLNLMLWILIACGTVYPLLLRFVSERRENIPPTGTNLSAL